MFGGVTARLLGGNSGVQSRTMNNPLCLELLGAAITIHCEDLAIVRALALAYDALVVAPQTSAAIDYRLTYAVDEGYVLAHAAGDVTPCRDLYNVLYYLDKWLTYDVQKLRPDLLFVHAAALEYAGNACLLVAPSGAGKSTTTWGLLHHGFNYLSDEHAVIDLQSRRVEPYPRALWLRQSPPAYRLPEVVLRTSQSIHVPTVSLPAFAIAKSIPLRTVYFLRHDPTAAGPSIRPISHAQASAHIFSQALHLNTVNTASLTSVVQLMATCQHFEVVTADLIPACELLQAHQARSM